MHMTLHGARLVDAQTDMIYGSMSIANGQITSVGTVAEDTGTVVDVSGMTIMPGFIDVHTHGGGGYSLHTTSADEILHYGQWAATTGVTSFLIGVVGTPNAMPLAQLQTAVQAIEMQSSGAQPVGIHLEGPYINPLRRGAHPISWLRIPSEDDTRQILEQTKGKLRLVTLAPELNNAASMIQHLIDAGVTVSIGHTDATYEQSRAAIGHGISHMTHCCNAMRPLHHREPGPLGAIVGSPNVFGEVIADGIHVHPVMLDILVRLLGAERVIVITDAQAGAGLPDAEFEFAGQPARNVDGVARLVDGTITGSVLTMDQALRNVLSMSNVTLSEAVGMFTWNPARSVKIAQTRGLLRTGFDADLAIFDESLTLQATICHGEVVFATEQWRERTQLLS